MGRSNQVIGTTLRSLNLENWEAEATINFSVLNTTPALGRPTELLLSPCW